jgi:hypothetical protein
MEKTDPIHRADDHNVDHYYQYLQANGLTPRKQGFGIPKPVTGNANVLGVAAQREGLPHIVSEISLPDVFRSR